MRAFHGDPGIKQDLRDRLAYHIKSGTLQVGETHWDGTSGSPLGVSAKSTDVDVYTQAFGYPSPLAGLLDPLTHTIGMDEEAFVYILSWVDLVEPGADLTGVPVKLMLHMLETAQTNDGCERMKRNLIDLHMADMAGNLPARADWNALRQSIARAQQVAEQDTPEQLLTLALLEAACWPAGRGYTPLSGTFAAYLNLFTAAPDPDWGNAEFQQCQVFFDSMQEELKASIEAGEHIDFALLLQQHHPDLARRYDAYNDRYGANMRRHAIDVMKAILVLLPLAPTITRATA